MSAGLLYNAGCEHCGGRRVNITALCCYEASFTPRVSRVAHGVHSSIEPEERSHHGPRFATVNFVPRPCHNEFQQKSIDECPTPCHSLGIE